MNVAKKMYGNLVDSPCAAALFNGKQLLKHYGRYDSDWWQSKLCNSSTTGKHQKDFEVKLRCETCGRRSQPEANYCAECGSRLDTQASIAETAARAPADSPAAVAMKAGCVSTAGWWERVAQEDDDADLV